MFVAKHSIAFIINNDSFLTFRLIIHLFVDKYWANSGIIDDFRHLFTRLLLDDWFSVHFALFSAYKQCTKAHILCGKCKGIVLFQFFVISQYYRSINRLLNSILLLDNWFSLFFDELFSLLLLDDWFSLFFNRLFNGLFLLLDDWFSLFFDGLFSLFSRFESLFVSFDLFLN